LLNDTLFQELPKGIISEILVSRIKDSLINGELRPGDKIPTETEFSKKLGIGRNSIREAIKVLIAFGVLEIKRSNGTYVVDEFSQKLLDPILYGMILADKSIKDLLEFKITFLNSVLYLAVMKATDEDIRCLRECYEAFHSCMQECPGDVQKNYVISKSFYKYLADMTRNPLVIQLNEIVFKISKYSRTKAIQISIDTGRRDYLVSCYLKILELVESREKRNISVVIDYVIEKWLELLL